MNKTIITVGLVVALVIGVFLGHEFWSQNLVGATGGPAGEVQTTAQIAQVSINGAPSGFASTTPTLWGSLYNGSGRDRVIVTEELAVFGVESNNTITVYYATSTTATSTVPNSITSVLLTNQSNIQWSHGTVSSGATTTPIVWPNGTYLNIVASSTATTSTLTGTGIATVKFNGE